jgi:hypothetical protein
MPDKLALPPEDFRAIAGAAVDFLASYFESLETRPVVVPTTSRAIRQQIDEPLPPPAPISACCSIPCAT